jgi:hypothetical protein
MPDPGSDKIVAFLHVPFLHLNTDCTGVFNLCTDADKERLGRQAIRAIHEQMDDDKDGMIETSESNDVSDERRSTASIMTIVFQFIKEELESKTDASRHHHFQSANLQITLDDLWKQWKNNAGTLVDDRSLSTVLCVSVQLEQ